MFAVRAVGVVPIGPTQLGNALTFKFHERKIAPAGKVQRNIMVARTAGAGIGRAQHLQVQQGAAVVAMHPQAQGGFVRQVHRRR